MSLAATASKAMGSMGRTSTLVLINCGGDRRDRVCSSSVVFGVEGRGIERFGGEPWVFWKISSRKRGRGMDWTAPPSLPGVGKAALKTVEEVQRHFNTNPGLRWKDKARVCNLLCQDDKMSTDASLKKMIPPDALVILTPLVVGNFFGVHTCSSCWLSGFCCAGCYLIFERRWGLVRIMQRNTWRLVLVNMPGHQGQRGSSQSRCDQCHGWRSS